MIYTRNLHLLYALPYIFGNNAHEHFSRSEASPIKVCLLVSKKRKKTGFDYLKEKRSIAKSTRMTIYFVVDVKGNRAFWAVSIVTPTSSLSVLLTFTSSSGSTPLSILLTNTLYRSFQLITFFVASKHNFASKVCGRFLDLFAVLWFWQTSTVCH